MSLTDALLFVLSEMDYALEHQREADTEDIISNIACVFNVDKNALLAKYNEFIND